MQFPLHSNIQNSKSFVAVQKSCARVNTAIKESKGQLQDTK